jgi:hemerythrin-like metal-binding protein
VAGLLEELLADTKEHLVHEERFMASVGFPESEAHRKGHDRFVAELVRLKELYEGGSPTVATRLSQLLRDWLSLHIRRNDKEVRLFLDKQRRLKALKKS